MPLIKKIKNIFKDDRYENKIIINFFFFFLLRVFAIVFTFVRTFLINKYIGVENLGLLSLMLNIAPLSIIFINATQNKAMYVLYKYSLKDNFNDLNVIINKQISEMKTSSFLSLFLVGFFMVISFFFMQSPGLNGYTSSLLVLSNSIEFLSFGLIVPYVQWYLNSIYKNYIYDIVSILFSWLCNIVVFIIIICYGNNLIAFFNNSHETQNTYIVLIISFVLTFKTYLSIIFLNLMKKKYMPWFKRDKKIKSSIFKRNSFAYIKQEFFSLIAVILIPFYFYILTFFIHLSTSIAGIYYSYLTFAAVITFVNSLINSLRPVFAKYFYENNSLYDLNKFLYKVTFIIGTILLLNYVIFVPYIMVLMKSYFSFVIVFLIAINLLITSLKSVDENFIYIDGRPEKYYYLTLIEVIISVFSLVIGLLIIFFVDKYSSNILNILYCILVCEIITRFTKLVLNIFYLNKYIYKNSIKIVFKDYWSIYLFFIMIIAIISLIISLMPMAIKQGDIYTNHYQLSIYSNSNINIIFNDDLSEMKNWPDLILFGFIANVILLAIESVYFYLFDKNLFRDCIKYIKILFKR